MDERYLRKLIEDSIGGSEDSFAAIIGMLQNKSYAIAYRYMGSDADARDMMQEAFIKLYRNLSTFKGRSGFETWFFRILINCCLDELRKRKPLEDIDEYPAIENEGRGTEEGLILKERAEAIRMAIHALPEDFKNVILLRELEGLSYEDVAAALGIGTGTVKSRLNRAKRKLKDIILEQNPDFNV